MRLTRVLVVAAAATMGLGVALADQPFSSELGARQGQFKLLAFNVGPIVAMAQGNMEYDAATAQLAADNIVALTSLDQSRLWPEGSGNDSIDNTRALPSIWADSEDFAAKFADLRSAALSMQEAAGTDLAALRGQLRALGGSCSACHEDYRQPE